MNQSELEEKHVTGAKLTGEQATMSVKRGNITGAKCGKICTGTKRAKTRLNEVTIGQFSFTPGGKKNEKFLFCCITLHKFVSTKRKSKSNTITVNTNLLAPLLSEVR